jgi:hypothetical protein
MGGLIYKKSLKTSKFCQKCWPFVTELTLNYHKMLTNNDYTAREQSVIMDLSNFTIYLVELQSVNNT